VVRIVIRMFFIVAVLVAPAAMPAQTLSGEETLLVQGYSGEAKVVRSQGHIFVDAQDLARITNGSLNFEKNRIILALPRSDTSQLAVDDAAEAAFSRAFMRAAIEAMGSVREWGGMLQVIVQNGYPVGKALAGNTIRAYQGRAADKIALAATATSTDSDNRGLELLRNEFNNVQAWAEAFVDARNSLSAADLSTSENAVNDNEGAQKLMHCGEFLAQMFASGTFQDDAACH
jgi:hypothetical protein